ncbi:MAG: glycosyltransferase family 4 protein [Chloroflexota bacterium]
MNIAFVTPWYGAKIPGGMESETRRTVTNLHRAGVNVEVLTTCIRDFYADWAVNSHQPGLTTVDGIPVRRFAVESRDKQAFDRINWQLMQGVRVSAEAEQTYINEMINCPTLYEYMAQQCHDTIFLFIPYMFATTYFGIQICPERSAVIPCLHDESYAYMSLYKEALSQAHTLIFHVEAEKQLAERLFGPAANQIRTVIGEGVDTDFSHDAARFREKYQLSDQFLLYVGRKEMGKNVSLLLDYWTQYVQRNQTEMKLVLIGKGTVPIPEAAAHHVVDLGFVPAQDKYDAYAAAKIFCQPSINESFSLVLMESWLTETPAVVHGHCAVTREHCIRSQGGLYFTNGDEFAAVIDYLCQRPAVARQMGRNGRSYVLANYQWPTIIARYIHIIETIQTANQEMMV